MGSGFSHFVRKRDGLVEKYPLPIYPKSLFKEYLRDLERLEVGDFIPRKKVVCTNFFIWSSTPQGKDFWRPFLTNYYAREPVTQEVLDIFASWRKQING